MLCTRGLFSRVWSQSYSLQRSLCRGLKFYQRNASSFGGSVPNNVQINPNMLSAQRWKKIPHQDLHWPRTSERPPPMRLRYTRPAQDWGCNKRTEEPQENPDKSPHPLREPAPSNTGSLYWRQAEVRVRREIPAPHHPKPHSCRHKRRRQQGLLKAKSEAGTLIRTF